MELLVIFSPWHHGFMTMRYVCDNVLMELPTRKAYPSLWHPEILLGLDHRLPTWLNFSLHPLLEVVTDMVGPKAPVINHIVRLFNNQSS